MENYLLLDSSGANLWSRVRHASSRMNISIDISDENKYSLIFDDICCKKIERSVVSNIVRTLRHAIKKRWANNFFNLEKQGNESR